MRKNQAGDRILYQTPIALLIPLNLHILEPLYSKGLRNIIKICLFHILLACTRASRRLV
ncbi:MAG: hypothetical protein NHB32_13665 [Fischerella sp. CENA71]|nr:hypothetical protein [Fischerella sp. CENA71]